MDIVVGVSGVVYAMEGNEGRTLLAGHLELLERILVVTRSNLRLGRELAHDYLSGLELLEGRPE